jgi:hypothetical protein
MSVIPSEVEGPCVTPCADTKCDVHHRRIPNQKRTIQSAKHKVPRLRTELRFAQLVLRSG